MPKKPINVECLVDRLSIDAVDWLADHVSDLAWVQRRWRIWESPAKYDELDSCDRSKWHYYKSKGLTFSPPMKKRWVDVVRFASKRDAMYFKLMFLP